MRFWFYLTCLVICSSAIKAQKCNHYLEEQCTQVKSHFNYQIHKASSSFAISSNENWELSFELNDNKDYRISLCSDSIFEGFLRMIIKNEDGKELFNNSEHQFQMTCEFSSKKNQIIKIEVTAPQPIYTLTDTIYSEGCAALLIEELNTIQTGF